MGVTAPSLWTAVSPTLSSYHRTKVQYHGSSPMVIRGRELSEVRGEAGRRDVLRLQSLLQCSGGIGRMGSSNTRQRIKETWIVRQTEDQPV